MARASSGDIEIEYEVQGFYDDDPPLVLIAGLGAQLIFFEDEFVQGLIDRAFRVIRLDNRDVGLSSWLDDHPVDLGEVSAAVAAGEQPDVPYTLSDMAADVVAVLDDAGIDRAHVLGVSLGGMIAQTLAIEFPDRVQSLSLLSSTTGAPDVGQPSPEALEAILAPAPEDQSRDAIVEADVAARTIWSTAGHFDEEWTREYFAASFDRGHHPSGQTRQMAAILTAPDREPDLAGLDVPTVILHGTADTLVAPDGGARLAELIPGAELVELDGMGHDLPPHYWAPIIEAITQLAVSAAHG
ncbi:MAG: alpha/beta fold hydrolase [Actinomycetota bacterium]